MGATAAVGGGFGSPRRQCRGGRWGWVSTAAQGVSKHWYSELDATCRPAPALRPLYSLWVQRRQQQGGPCGSPPPGSKGACCCCWCGPGGLLAPGLAQHVTAAPTAVCRVVVCHWSWFCVWGVSQHPPGATWRSVGLCVGCCQLQRPTSMFRIARLCASQRCCCANGRQLVVIAHCRGCTLYSWYV